MKVVSQTFLWQSMSSPMSEGVCSSRWRRVGSCCLGNYVNSLFVGCVVNWDYFWNQLIKEKKKKYNQCFWSERERENLKECFSLDCLCHRGRCGSEILLNLEITCAWGNIPALSPLGSAVDRKLDLKKKRKSQFKSQWRSCSGEQPYYLYEPLEGQRHVFLCLISPCVEMDTSVHSLIVFFVNKYLNNLLGV